MTGDNKALTIQTPTEILEKVVAEGDLGKLSSGERLIYYQRTCESLGMNPLTRPFEYIRLNDKLTLYARRDATDQLRQLHRVNVTIVARELVDSVYIVTARATMPDGRTDESIGAVPLCKEDGEWKTSESGKRYFKGNGRFLPLSPEERANGMMKAETKAKRRVTLSIVGLGMLDETEIETIQGARVVTEAELHNVHEPTPQPVTPSRQEPASRTDGDGVARIRKRLAEVAREEDGASPGIADDEAITATYAAIEAMAQHHNVQVADLLYTLFRMRIGEPFSDGQVAAWKQFAESEKFGSSMAYVVKHLDAMPSPAQASGR